MALSSPRLLAAALVALLLACPSWLAAQPLRPEALSNRRLGNLNDASALGWNPALLGVQWKEYELLAVTGYDSEISLTHSLYALFGKLGPVALGTTGPLGDSAGLFTTRRYHAGLGFPIVEDEVWAGAGAEWLDGRGFLPSAEYTIAGLYRPRPDVLAGLTLGNLTSNNDGSLWLDLHAAYVPADWLTFFAGARFDDRDTLGGFAAFTPSIGASVGLLENTMLLSGGYDFNHGSVRLGLEAVFGDVSFGSINGLDRGGLFSGGVATARWSSLTEQSIGAYMPGGGGDDDDDLGWAPDRAYIPSGLEYTESASTSDAMRTQSAVSMPCTGGVASRYDSPTGLAAIIDEAGETYAPLAARVREIAPSPGDLFRNIRKRYYSPPVRNRELSSGDTLSIVSKQGHAISVQSVDAARFPLVSVIMRVTDETGRSVPRLGAGDFSFQDSSTRIVSVRPTDSSFSVPVDIVIMVDCSGSMSDEIESVRQNVGRFVDNLEARGIDYRIGGVLYGSAIYDTLHPTRDLARYREFLASAAPIGGDEITTLAMKAATEMEFRPGSQRVFMMITDDWTVQNNARLDEPQLTQMLWDTRARLYSIISPCKNNSAVTTRLTLGREFDIASPFTGILDEIGTDLTTTYELVYESQVQKEEVAPPVTILRGRVRDETGAPVATTLTLDARGHAPMTVATNGTTGEYETEISEGLEYAVRIGGTGYLPLSAGIDLGSASPGDTITRDFVLRIRPTTVVGRITDENDRPIAAEVRIEDATTLERIDTVEGTGGQYSATVVEGKVYRLTPSARNYIPFPEEVDARVPKGTEISRDLKVMSIDAAIASGAVFRLKNIFFDFDRADLKPESFQELDRLAALLAEYPVINVEIGAHTDSKGSDTYNATLSARRAQSVREYLVAQGVAAERLTSKGYGETVPVATNETDEGRAQNRRVEFKLVR